MGLLQRPSGHLTAPSNSRGIMVLGTEETGSDSIRRGPFNLETNRGRMDRFFFSRG